MEKLYTEEQTLEFVKGKIEELCRHHGVDIGGGYDGEVILSMYRGNQLINVELD